MILVDNGTVASGFGLRRGDYYLDIHDGNASVTPYELAPGLSVDTCSWGTSQVNEENVSAMLEDAEVAGLFEALLAFMEP